MKTPIDSASAGAGATVALLDGAADFAMIDLWKITLNGGAVIYWHSGPMTTPVSFTHFGDQPSAADGTYLPGPLIDRGKISTKLGLEVASLDMKISATLADLIGAAQLIPFAQGRGFDGATVVLYRGYLPAFGQPITGVTVAFSGRVTALKNVSRSQFTMTVSAWTVLLNVNMGPDLYQAGCLNTHYDPDCGLMPTNVSGTVSGSPTATGFSCTGSAAGEADHFFDKGTLTFTSGANAGLSRAVQSFASSTFSFAFGFPAAPAPGDTFNAVRGCLLTLADCTAQSNEVHFRGQPFIPPAITGVG